MTPDEEHQLTKGVECYIHQHPRHIIDADDVYNAQAARIIKVVSTAYTLSPNDEIILVDTAIASVVITLPHSDFQKEYQIVKVDAANTLTVIPTSPDTILGMTGVVVTASYTSMNFKMDTLRANWVLI